MDDLIKVTPEDKDIFEFWCPGCKHHHFIDRRKWEIDLITNTLRPSVLVKGVNNSDEWETDENGDYVMENGRVKGAKNIVCHSFVRSGNIQFLNDCTHELAGKTVPMEKI